MQIKIFIFADKRANANKEYMYIHKCHDGKDDSDKTLRIGIYIIFLEAINEGSGVVENMKTVVVVARKL